VRYKATADKKRRECLRRKGHGNSILVKGKNSCWSYNNLKPWKYESFKIIKKINDNAYVVDLSSDMTMFKIFNVTDLYEYYPTKKLYPDDNSRMSSFEEG